MIINDCWEYLVEVEPSLTADTLKAIEKLFGELEFVPIFLVSDTDIEATANQRWTSEGPLVNPHVIRVVIASQWHRSLFSS